jgi:hypothetical protein
MHIERIESGRKLSSAALFCRRIVRLIWVLAALATGQYAGAIEVSWLYTVEVPFDQADPNARRDAYRTALSEILVRITGTTAAVESEDLALTFPNPAQFVTQFRPGPDDSLVVSMDGVEIERVLRQTGATVWSSERPLTVIWLAVDWGLGEREIVAADDADRLPGAARSIDRNRQLRERVLEVATRRGIPVVFPLMDTEDLQNIGFSDIWGGFDDQLLEASSRYEATSVLVGRIRADTAQPPRWTWYLGDSRFGWPGAPEEAIDELANALAGRYAFQGDQSLERIELTINGIDSVDAYGRVQRYLENLRVIDRLAVTSAAPEKITYMVDVQGGIDRLENALDLSFMLERGDAGFVIDAGTFPDRSRPGQFDSAMPSPSGSLVYRYRGEPQFEPETGTGN